MAITNETIGEIDCAWCGTTAPVRKNKNNKLYLVCSNCGQQPLNLPGGQAQILEKARLFGAATPKVAANPPQTAPDLPEQREPEPEKAQKPAKKGFMSWLDD